MPARNARAPMTMLAFLAVSALLVACGDSGGGTGGAGGGAGTGGSTTTTTTGTGTTSTTTTAAGCIELCTELNKCPDITPADCAAACPDVDMLNEAGQCAPAYATLVACMLAAPDPCKAYDNDCINESAAYVTCTSDYCDTNPSAPACP